MPRSRPYAPRYGPRRSPRWFDLPALPPGLPAKRLGVLELGAALELEVWTEAGRSWAFVVASESGAVLAVLGAGDA